MNKENLIVIIISITVLIGAIFTAIVIRSEHAEKIKIEEKKISISEEVTDECTEEYEEYINEIIEPVSSSEDKISTNAILILKKYYIECEHTINEYVEMPPELINMTEKEIQEEYPEWEVIGFSNNEVILYKEYNERCKEHFILKNEEQKIVIYKILENGELELYQKTDISAEYLTETDLINIQDGLEVYGKENLNKILEDFE